MGDMNYYPPNKEKANYFKDDNSKNEFLVKIGFFKAKPPKMILYRSNDGVFECKIVGYTIEYSDGSACLIIEINEKQTCIHSAYLKEMQSKNFGQKGEIK